MASKGEDVVHVLPLVRILRTRGMSEDEIIGKLGIDRDQVAEVIATLHESGYNPIQRAGRWQIDQAPAPAYSTSSDLPTYYSRPDNTYLFGAVGDTHLGSKYERMDVLNDLYGRFADAGADRVFHTGNWVDGYGRAGFNLHDLKIHGLDEQMRYLAAHYPRHDGLTTFAVSGNDHEGWWAQREGIDVGSYAERAFRDAGRADWVDLGYMEAHIRLVNSNTGTESILAVVHPGGGSGYALSYAVQKIVEALEGGEKPAVALYGHYHKLWSGNIRNVWVVCTGCTQDQTTFMRSKVKQEAHVGGTLIGLEQDPRTGAIVSMTPRLYRYFNRGFYNHRWSLSGDVTLPERKEPAQSHREGATALHEESGATQTRARKL